jgi:hypothetical protein
VTSNGSGYPHKNKPLEKKVEHLEKVAANQAIELAKAKERHKAYKEATAAVSYSATAQPPTQNPPAPRHLPEYPPLQSRQQANAGAPTLDLAGVLSRMEARMVTMELMLSRTA